MALQVNNSITIEFGTDLPGNDPFAQYQILYTQDTYNTSEDVSLATGINQTQLTDGVTYDVPNWARVIKVVNTNSTYGCEGSEASKQLSEVDANLPSIFRYNISVPYDNLIAACNGNLTSLNVTVLCTLDLETIVVSDYTSAGNSVIYSSTGINPPFNGNNKWYIVEKYGAGNSAHDCVFQINSSGVIIDSAACP